MGAGEADLLLWLERAGASWAASQETDPRPRALSTD